MAGNLIYYQFTRSNVEQGDFGHFLGLYGPGELPDGRRLRKMMNRFVFCIDGWDSDSREIHMVPEIRRFYATFHDSWPYWLFFCNLEVHTLRAMVLCCLPFINTMQVDGRTQVQVACESNHLLDFLKPDFMQMNLMFDRAEMLEDRLYDRTEAIFEYFGLPFNPSPPS